MRLFGNEGSWNQGVRESQVIVSDAQFAITAHAPPPSERPLSGRAGWHGQLACRSWGYSPDRPDQQQQSGSGVPPWLPSLIGILPGCQLQTGKPDQTVATGAEGSTGHSDQSVMPGSKSQVRMNTVARLAGSVLVSGSRRLETMGNKIVTPGRPDQIKSPARSSYLPSPD